MNDLELLASLLNESSLYLQTAIVCKCGAMYCLEYDDHLAKHELRWEKPDIQTVDTLELETKCCPGMSTAEGMKFYWIDTEYALTQSDLNDPILMTTFACPSCGTDHPVLLDGHHRMYRALVENKPSLPTHLMSGNYNVSCTKRTSI